MKISVAFIMFSSAIIFTECAKSYRFLTLKSCKADNEVVGVITKCEVDGIYFTINIFVKVPITKAFVSFIGYSIKKTSN